MPACHCRSDTTERTTWSQAWEFRVASPGRGRNSQLQPPSACPAPFAYAVIAMRLGHDGR
jgi:hypothetical protein